MQTDSPATLSAGPNLPTRVLLVEDEFLLRMMIATHLRDSGFEVIEAFNGDEAIALLCAGAAVDVVLTDVRMPGGTDGLALAAFVRRRSPTMTVVVTSGHLDPEQAYAAGATRFLCKPCDLDELAEALRTERGQGH